jgi:hypothetical protein
MRAAGMKGIGIFEFNGSAIDDWLLVNALAVGPFAQPAEPCQ